MTRKRALLRDVSVPGSHAEIESLREQVRALQQIVGLQDAIIHRAAALLEQHEPRLAALEQSRTRPEPTRYISAAVVARELGCDTRTVRRWIAEGRILGRALPIPRSSRRRWLVRADALERLRAADNALPAAPAARGSIRHGTKTAEPRKLRGAT